MPDQTNAPPSESEGSISWKLIRGNLARREFSPGDMVEVEKVSSAANGKVEVSGKDAAGAPVQRQIEPDSAFDRIAAEAIQTSRQVKELHDQAKKEAIIWFWTSAAAAVLGFMLVVIGIVAVLFFQQSMAAVLSGVCGVLLEVIAKLFINQHTAANKRVDEYRKDLLEALKFDKIMKLLGTITDPEAKRRQTVAIIKMELDTAMGQKSK